MSFYVERIQSMLKCSEEEAVAIEAEMRRVPRQLDHMHAALFKHEAEHARVAVRKAAEQPLVEQMLLPITTRTGLELELNVDVAEVDGDMVTVFVNESSIGFSLVVRRGDLKPKGPGGKPARVRMDVVR
jgi:hypothetical protein